jgi:pimeloyl-ACP methyl ester carboxylesterase
MRFVIATINPSRRLSVNEAGLLSDPLQQGFDDFLRRSIERPGLSRHFDATGIRIHYLEWPGPPGAPALLLLHGFLAHAHWWDFIAHWLAEEYRVIAPDFGGMGDSEHRPEYRHELFFEEVAATIRHAGIAPCTVIGHSFGGRALLYACKRYPELIARGIVVDSRLTAPDDPMRGFDEAWRPKKRYPDLQTILGRFVLRPDEPAPAAALDHMARASVRADGDAFIWKFDDGITHLFRGGSDRPVVDEAVELAALTTPLDIIRGEWSKVVTAPRAQRMVACLPTARGPIALPCGYHHLPVSQPQPLLAALRALLANPRQRSIPNE